MKCSPVFAAAFLIALMQVRETVACSSSVIRSPKGKLCPSGTCAGTSSWSLANAPYFPMEMVAYLDGVRLQNVSDDTLVIFADQNHYDNCNFTDGSSGLTLPFSEVYGCSGSVGLYGSEKYCNQGLKVKITWVSSTTRCATLTNRVGTDGLAYSSGLNWMNGTGVKPPITIPVTSKVVFNFTGTHDVKMFSSAAHYANCNFTDSISIAENVFCAYHVRDEYFSTGQTTFYLGSSSNQDCAQGLKLQVTIAASNVLSVSLLVAIVFSNFVVFS